MYCSVEPAPGPLGTVTAWVAKPSPGADYVDLPSGPGRRPQTWTVRRGSWEEELTQTMEEDQMQNQEHEAVVTDPGPTSTPTATPGTTSRGTAWGRQWSLQSWCDSHQSGQPHWYSSQCQGSVFGLPLWLRNTPKEHECPLHYESLVDDFLTGVGNYGESLTVSLTRSKSFAALAGPGYEGLGLTYPANIKYWGCQQNQHKQQRF